MAEMMVVFSSIPENELLGFCNCWTYYITKFEAMLASLDCLCIYIHVFVSLDYRNGGTRVDAKGDVGRRLMVYGGE